MASAFQNAWQTALEAEKELLKNLAEKEPTYTGITHFLSEFRAACQNAILQDFETARSIDVEGRLWDAHLKINTRFRKLLARFREGNGKKKPVEKRKLEKHYLDFIKSSQRFYREYIQRLSSHFGGIVELEKVARKFNFDNPSAEPSVKKIPDNLRKLILRSCHATLIRLGDLSRYRETELVSKDRHWGPAVGYYDLASLIYPASGASHNQLAIIALADGNHLRATYHLYRALTALEAHPSAKGNLEIEFRKVLNAWTKKELIRPEDAGVPGRSLAPWFVYLHAQCYKGIDFPEHDELENEVINQLAVDLKERSLEDTLQKFCLINIAAEDFARARPNEEPKSNARLFFQRINVKTFFTLLQVLLAELERFAGEEPDEKNGETGSEKVTVVARRILPALRHYSSWLLAVSHLLAAQKEDKDTTLSVQVKEFWKIYANALTLLTSTFDVVHLPGIDYLLEEDEDMLGFAPLLKEATSRRYLDVNGQLKPRMSDNGVERNHPSVEMLYRVRELVIDGLDLVVSNRIPIALINDEEKKTFVYKEEGLPTQIFSSPHGKHHALSSTSVAREEIPPPARDPNGTTESRSTFGGSQSATTSVNADMHRIVEGVERLVESDVGESAAPVPERLSFLDNAGPPTPQARPFELNAPTSFQNNNVRRTGTPIAPPGLYPPVSKPIIPGQSLSQSYNPRPTLPGIPSIWNTAFSPQVADSRIPRAPPGLGQRPVNPIMPMNGVASLPPQEQIADDLYRQSLLNSAQFSNAFDQSGPPYPSWLSPNPAVPNQQFPNPTWQRSPFGGSNPYMGSLNQSPSSSLANAPWANNAFIANSLSSGMQYPSPGFGDARRTASQLGAVGQTPPFGQGG